MKIEIELPEIEGYEYTGEYRAPKDGEYYTHQGKVIECGMDAHSEYIIIKKKAPKYAVITQGDFLQLCEGRRVGHVDLSARYVEIKALEDLMRLSFISACDMSNSQIDEWTDIEELIK